VELIGENAIWGLTRLLSEPSDDFERKVFRKSKSTSTLRFYRSGRKKFEQFCRYEIKADIPETARRVKQGEIDVYKLLDRYADGLQGQGLRAKTVVGYANGAKKILRHHDVLILNELFLEKVTLPTVEEILDEAPTPDEIRLILGRCSPRMKALILVLATSGMRLGEALLLRTKDVEFTSNPVRILIPAAYTKNSRERETYITEEASTATNEWLAIRKAKSLVSGTRNTVTAESRLFNFEGVAHMAEKGASHVFRRVMRHFPELDRPTCDGHRVHKIHFHSFRKFFFSRTMPVIGEERAHALMGHSFYMKTYYRRSKEDRMADYAKCVDALAIVRPSRLIAPEDVDKKATLKFYWLSIENSPFGRPPKEVLEEAERNLGRKLTLDDQIDILRDVYQGPGGVREQEIALMEEGTDRVAPEKQSVPSQKVILGPEFERRDIPRGELQAYLDQDWEPDVPNPPDRFIVKRKRQTTRELPPEDLFEEGAAV
jgi:integrase